MEPEVEFINTQDDSGICLQITYNGVKYKVKVWKGELIKQAFVSCSFTPSFGMDVIDQTECFKVAYEIEKELGL